MKDIEQLHFGAKETQKQRAEMLLVPQCLSRAEPVLSRVPSVYAHSFHGWDFFFTGQVEAPW